MKCEFLLEARSLCKYYRCRRWPGAALQRTIALQDVSFAVTQGLRIALVGRSGSGKSTLARCLANLEKPDSGEVWFERRNVSALSARWRMVSRRSVQLVFQQSATALNPSFSAQDAVAEPLRIQGENARARRLKAVSLMEETGIPSAWADRSPLEFSGGERQRLAIARALILEPRALILDEALAGLDRATQAKLTQLLIDLQTERNLSCVFITHDLRLAADFAGEIAVMDRGQIVERAPVAQFFKQPQSATARDLVAAIPEIPG